MKRRLGSIVSERRLGSIVTASVVLPTAVLALAAGPRGVSTTTSTGRGTLEEAEKATLTYIREEEKLARDVYITLSAVWPVRVFAQIADSEQAHMDAVLKMLTKYGLPDPAEGLEVGQFSDTSGLQKIYDGLVEAGAMSKTKALEAGVFIEETDIEDLTAAIAETDNPDLDQMYGHLKAGSVRHLLAFSRHLATLQANAESE